MICWMGGLKPIQEIVEKRQYRSNLPNYPRLYLHGELQLVKPV
jgi:hypothetical protein